MGGTVIIIFFLAVTVVPVYLSRMAALRQSPVFQEALARALANPQVVSELGDPVRPARFISGKLRTRGQFGFANFDAPLAGSRDRGTLSGLAFQIRGQWQFRRLEVENEGSPSIDLLPAGNAK